MVSQGWESGQNWLHTKGHKTVTSSSIFSRLVGICFKQSKPSLSVSLLEIFLMLFFDNNKKAFASPKIKPATIRKHVTLPLFYIPSFGSGSRRKPCIECPDGCHPEPCVGVPAPYRRRMMPMMPMEYTPHQSSKQMAKIGLPWPPPMYTGLRWASWGHTTPSGP